MATPAPGWYRDPAGSPRLAYWNGYAWQLPPPRPPNNKRGLIIAGSVIGVIILLNLLSGLGDDGQTVTSSITTTETATKTVTAPPAAAAPPHTVTVTATPPVVTVTQAAPQAPGFLNPPPIAVPTFPSSAYYSNCADARAAGAAPLYAGQPGYRPGLDRDNDGVACE